MVSVDPSHLAARVTPFGVGVNAPDVEVPKFGESLPERAFLLAFPPLFAMSDASLARLCNHFSPHAVTVICRGCASAMSRATVSGEQIGATGVVDDISQSDAMWERDRTARAQRKTVNVDFRAFCGASTQSADPSFAPSIASDTRAPQTAGG